MSAIKQTMCGLWIVALAGNLIAAVPVPRAQNPIGPLPARIVASWQDAGAQSGWLDLTRHEDALFFDQPVVLRFCPQGKDGEVPGFWFKEWRPGRSSDCLCR